MWWRSPEFSAIKFTPRRAPAVAPQLVISKSLTSQYSWFLSRNASSARSDASMIGLAVPPYLPMMIGCPALPDPLGHKCPVHLPPDLKRMPSPGANVVAFTFSRVFQASVGEPPEL